MSCLSEFTTISSSLLLRMVRKLFAAIMLLTLGRYLTNTTNFGAFGIGQKVGRVNS